MVQKLRTFLFMLVWLPLISYAEDSKQLTPKQPTNALTSLSGAISCIIYNSLSNEYDKNEGNAISFNNELVNLTIEDRPPVVQVLQTNKHYFFFQTGQPIAEISDPDGAIQSVMFISGTLNGQVTSLPAGTRLSDDGKLEVSSPFFLVPGIYALTIETIDEHGGKSEVEINYSISGDWDNDGKLDTDDIDDNNDGVITEADGVDATEDDDGDAIPNYLDHDFVHPVYGAFRDVNGDEINDAFDLDLDGLVRGFDIDIDGDGITNAIEANGGVIPSGYDRSTGTFTGQVSANGMPLVIQTSNNSGISTLPNPDTDGDGRRDYEDVDADNDVITDIVEAQSTQGYIIKSLNDTDRDGLNNNFDPSCGCDTNGTEILPVDTDGDGLKDYLDIDSDDDGSPDYVEAFDDDQDGKALNDLIARAAHFEQNQQRGFYTTDDANQNGVPNWLELLNGKPAYLVPTSKTNSYYHDTNQDGLVDLMDLSSGGQRVTLQTKASSNEYDFRSDEDLIVLPVTLVKFTGRYQNRKVLLNWATATEKNNAFFTIERSADGKNFTAIGQVEGAGNSVQWQQYQFTDFSPLNNTNYYRLKQTDKDHTFGYSSIIAVQVPNKLPETNKVTLFPNPTANLLHIDMTALAATRYQVSIISIDGRVIQKTDLEGGRVQQLSVSNLAAGKYLLRIQNEQELQTHGFIKN